MLLGTAYQRSKVLLETVKRQENVPHPKTLRKRLRSPDVEDAQDGIPLISPVSGEEAIKASVSDL